MNRGREQIVCAQLVLCMGELGGQRMALPQRVGQGKGLHWAVRCDQHINVCASSSQVAAVRADERKVALIAQSGHLAGQARPARSACSHRGTAGTEDQSPPSAACCCKRGPEAAFAAATFVQASTANHTSCEPQQHPPRACRASASARRSTWRRCGASTFCGGARRGGAWAGEGAAAGWVAEG